MQENSTVRLMRDNPYVRPLENAKRVVGGDQQLAAVLSTSTETLSRWLSGEAQPPMKTFMAVVHLVGRSGLKSRQ